MGVLRPPVDEGAQPEDEILLGSGERSADEGAAAQHVRGRLVGREQVGAHRQGAQGLGVHEVERGGRAGAVLVGAGGRGQAQLQEAESQGARGPDGAGPGEEHARRGETHGHNVTRRGGATPGSVAVFLPWPPSTDPINGCGRPETT